MKRSLICLGAGLLVLASGIGIQRELIGNDYVTRQNVPQVNRVLELEGELFKLTGGMTGSEALEKYVNDTRFREAYDSLANEYNSLITQVNISDAVSSIKKSDLYTGYNAMLLGVGIMSTIIGLQSLLWHDKIKEKK